MAEWLKVHAWKVCVPSGTVGSNPTLSAINLTFYFLKYVVYLFKKFNRF